MEIIGDVAGRRCIMIDDMIDTGGSIINGAEALLKRGATEVIASCTHPVFSGAAPQRLQGSPVSMVVTLDTIPIPDNKRFGKLVLLESSPLLGEAIKRIYQKRSVSELFDQWR
jgi:ribose-phosphate pyrophosphokinase